MATGTQRPLQDRTQGGIQTALQLKRIEGGAGLAQLFLGRLTHVGAGQQPVTGRHGPVVAAFDFGPVAVFAQQFGRGAEVVVERFPDVPVERVDLLAQGRVFEPVSYTHLRVTERFL